MFMLWHWLFGVLTPVDNDYWTGFNGTRYGSFYDTSGLWVNLPLEQITVLYAGPEA